MKRRITSIFLLLIILLAQIGLAVIAAEDTSKTLEQYLIESGLDKDNNGTLSEKEWAKIKNLNLINDYGGTENIKDIKNIEKAINSL